jgi:hypothetical protein
VIAAFELHDQVAAGEAAREPKRAHRCLGAGRYEPHELDRGNEPADRLREFDLGSVGAPNESARDAAARTASTTSGCVCPAIIGPHEPT